MAVYFPSAGAASSGGSGRSYSVDVAVWPPRPSTEATDPPAAVPKATPQAVERQPAGINLPQSQEGTPVPYICGRVRVDSNILWWGNDDTEVTTSKYLDADGVQQVLTTYRDTIDVMFGICSGPGVHLRAVYGDNDAVLWSGDAGVGVTVLSPGVDGAVFSGGIVTWYSGEFNQPVNTELDNSITESVPAFVGTAYVWLVNGDRANTTPFSFEVQRVPNPLALDNATNVSGDGNDVNPMTLAIDFMTTKLNGLGYDIGRFDQASFSSCASILASEGNFLSVAISAEGVASTDIISLIEAQIDGCIFIHPGTGLITCRLFREELVDLDDTSILHLEMSDILEHPSWSKTYWVDANDQIRAIYSDRTDGYQQVPVIAQTVSVAASGGRAAKTKQVQFPLVCTKELATKLAARELSLASTPRHGTGLVVNRKGALLLPGDVVKVSYAPYTFDAQPFFVMRRRDMAKKDNKVTLQLSQFKSPNNAVFTPPEESGFFEQVRDPLPPESVLIIDAPYIYTYRTQQGAAPPNPWSDISIPMSLAKLYSRYQAAWYMQYDPSFNSDDTYLIGPRETGRSGGYCALGQLHSSIGEFDGVTTGKINIVVDGVSRSVAGPPLTSGANTYLMIDDEMFVIRQQALVGTTLTLTNVDRAMADTVKQAHSAGATVYILPLVNVDAGDLGLKTVCPALSFDVNVSPQVSPSFKYVGIAYSNGAYSDISPSSLIQDYTPASRYIRPLRPHDTKIGANARSSSAVNIARSSTPTINFKVRSRWFTGYFDDTLGEQRLWNPDSDWRLVFNRYRDFSQSEGSQYKEYDSDNAKYCQYRAMLKDSAGTVWNMGNTSDSDYASHSIVATVPAGAATGAGLLWVEAYNDYSDSSPWKDTLPVNVT